MSDLKGSEIIITFLGTGSAIPPLNRQQSAISLVHQKGTIIFDCGEGMQYQLRKNKISTNKEFVICITHLHSDHTLGLPGLISSFQLQGRTEKIKVIGPRGIAEYLKRILYAFYVVADFQLEIIELAPEEEYSGVNYRLLAKKARHESPGGAISYIWIENDGPDKFDTDKLDTLNIPRGPHLGKLQKGLSIEINGVKIDPQDVMFKGRRGRVIAFTGDTSPNKIFMQQLPSFVDVLIHEASFPNEMEKMAFERGHSTFLHAAQMAKLANIDLLILTHISPRFTFKQLKIDLAYVKKLFPNTIVANDGMRHIIPLPEAVNTI